MPSKRKPSVFRGYMGYMRLILGSGLRVSQNKGVFEVRIVRIIVFGGLYWGPPCHVIGSCLA